MAALLLLGLYGFARSRPRHLALRSLRWVIVGLLAVLHAVWLYGALTVGLLLRWTAPATWAMAPVVGLVVAALVTARRSWSGPQIPFALPLGLWLAACLTGWAHENWYVRCDDYEAARRQASFHLVAPSIDYLDRRCSKGGRITVGAFPRRVLEDDEDDRYLVVSALPMHRLMRTARMDSEFDGLVCEVPRKGGRPSCLKRREGERAHAIVEAGAIDRFFVAVMAGLPRHPTVDSSGCVVALRRHGPLARAGAATLPIHGDSLVYDSRGDVLRVFGDREEGTVLMRASTLEVLTVAPTPRSVNDAVRYDPAGDRGVLCGGENPLARGGAFLALAFESAEKLAVRPLGASARYTALSPVLKWGCDWDGEDRVYVPLATAGLLIVVDYRTGAVLERHFVGLGMQATVLDRARGRLYLADSNRGQVVAFTISPFREVRRWFAGRFVQDLVLTRDGRGLLVASNLGLTRLDLE